MIGESGEGHKWAQKINPAGKVSAAQQKGDRTQRWFENGLQQVKNPSSLKAALLSVPADDGDLHGGHNNELKWQRETCRAETGRIFNAQENAFGRCRDLLVEGQ